MSTTTHERATTPRPGGERPFASTEGPTTPTRTAPPPNATPGPRYRVMFAVSFRTAMSDADLYRLHRVLDMSTHLHPKLRASPVSPGLSRLDFFSGLFLLRGDRPQEWRLEGRTWGAPALQSVHDWHVLAADAARLLDPAVPVPARLSRSDAPRAHGLASGSRRDAETATKESSTSDGRRT
jgi:hypothetical protein